MCVSQGGSSQQSASLSAFHPEELVAQAHLQLDRDYYLRHQLHAVVARLCEPITGLDSAQLASCLGEWWRVWLVGVASGLLCRDGPQWLQISSEGEGGGRGGGRADGLEQETVC